MTPSLPRRLGPCRLLAAGFALLATACAVSAWAHGDDTEPIASKPKEYQEGLLAIKAKDYQAGIEWMKKAIAVNPKDADAYNYLGYSYRKLGHYTEAILFYTHALELDPNHRGAHEYLGEAYLEMDQLDEAKKQLAALDSLCWLPCAEYQDLKEAVEKYQRGKKNEPR
jgi:tetratricopeptide (TPR) repeat protein